MKSTLPIKIDLPDGFLAEEIRCGYTVCEKQKKIWAIELDLLNELMRVCNEHKIKFQMFAGTLLGAERHKGFIPWDDDLDVILDRRNFRKLCRVANEFKHPYFLQTALTDRKYYFGYARLRNSLTTGVISWQQTPDYNGGIFIDVYVMDGVASGRLHGIQKRLLGFVDEVRRDLQTGERKPFRRYWLPYIIRKFLYWKGYDFTVAVHDWVMNMPNFVCTKIGQLTHGFSIYSEHWITKKEFAHTEQIDFESLSVPVPINRKEILSRIYGDYMKFPPAEELGKWHEGIIHFEPDISYHDYFERIRIAHGQK